MTSDPGLRFRVVDALADLVEELALPGPLMIGLDDLQWADPSSLLTLSALSRRVEYLPVGLIACFRPLPRPPELDRLVAWLAAAAGRHLSLCGLTEQAVTDLVADAVAAVPGRGLLAGISGAAGNPLFVTEILGALAQEGMIETSSGRAEVAQMILPPTLRLTILRRLSFLPDDTLHTLRAASILGSSFTMSDLSVTMARSALELFQVLAEAITGRVLEDDGARLRFRHDLIRDAIYEDLPVTIRSGLHREAGQRLARAGAPSLTPIMRTTWSWTLPPKSEPCSSCPTTRTCCRCLLGAAHPFLPRLPSPPRSMPCAAMRGDGAAEAGRTTRPGIRCLARGAVCRVLCST